MSRQQQEQWQRGIHDKQSMSDKSALADKPNDPKTILFEPKAILSYLSWCMGQIFVHCNYCLELDFTLPDFAHGVYTT